MGKIFDALRKAASESSSKLFGSDQEGLKRSAETAALAPIGADSTVPGAEEAAPAVTRKSFQILPVSELLVVGREDGNREASFAAEQCRMLRTRILFSGERPVPKTIMVTSAIPGEGKTFVAANLAVSIAAGKQEHVLLIECDLRRPGMGQLFGIRNAPGLSDYLQGKEDLPNLFCKTSFEKLTLLFGGTLTRTPYELLASQRMKDFLEEVRNRYHDRYIILDCTPAQVAAETGVLTNFVDGIVLVVRYGKSSRKILRETLDRLGKEKVLGVVFNGYEGRFTTSYYYKYYGPEKKRFLKIFPRP
jgi:protein-tyrosine kinase